MFSSWPIKPFETGILMQKLMHSLPFLPIKLFSACPEYLLRYLHLPVSVYILLCSFSLVHRLIGTGNHVKEVNHYPSQGMARRLPSTACPGNPALTATLRPLSLAANHLFLTPPAQNCPLFTGEFVIQPYGA